MKRLLLSAVLVAAIILAGCTTASRTTTGKDGAVTSTKVSTFLTTIQGFQDSVTSPDGTQSSTSVNNYASDVQAIQAIFSGMQNLGQLILLAENGTNINPVVTSNLFALQARRK